MSVTDKLRNNVCKMLYFPESKRFHKPCDLEQVQNAYLQSLIQKNKNTLFGKAHNFSQIKNYEDFIKHVPILSYEEYEPYVRRIADGEKNVLTAEDVLLLELTSGSSGGKKFIPYTKSLKKEFQKGIKPWLYDILKNIKGVKDGKSYWSITPVTSQKSYTKAGIPIGFEEDAAYFGKIEKYLLDQLFAVDASVKFSNDMAEFYEKTTTQLLQNRKKLTLISVWNPTFLSILCDWIQSNHKNLSQILSKEEQDALGENRFDVIFPKLKLISCWADGSAKDSIKQIQTRFPCVPIQPKGLLATECFVSFPLVNETGSRLSIHSHFFEFRRISDQKIFRTHQLETGEYELIVTTGGGFYRYAIGDVIEVLKTFPNQPPVIRFLRRTGTTSDLFGEKLTESFVVSCMQSLGIGDDFYLLAPKDNGYCLYTTNKTITEDLLDKVLCESFHYAYCRKLGQLKKAKVMLVGGNPEEIYLSRLVSEGQRLGDIKPAHLSKLNNWDEWFLKG